MFRILLLFSSSGSHCCADILNNGCFFCSATSPEPWRPNTALNRLNLTLDYATRGSGQRRSRAAAFSACTKQKHATRLTASHNEWQKHWYYGFLTLFNTTLKPLWPLHLWVFSESTVTFFSIIHFLRPFIHSFVLSCSLSGESLLFITQPSFHNASQFEWNEIHWRKWLNYLRVTQQIL